MEEAYLRSDVHKRVVSEKDEYKQFLAKDNAAIDEFRLAVTEQKYVDATP